MRISLMVALFVVIRAFLPGEGPIQSVTLIPGYMAIAITMEKPPPDGLLTEVDSAVVPTKAAAVNDLVTKLRALDHKWPELDAVMLSVYDVELQAYTRWERRGQTYYEQ